MSKSAAKPQAPKKKQGKGPPQNWRKSAAKPQAPKKKQGKGPPQNWRKSAAKPQAPKKKQGKGPPQNWRKSAAKPQAPKKKQGKGPPQNWRVTFCRALERTGVVATACAKAKVSRQNAYQLRNRSPEFRDEWDEALEIALDGLEEEAHRRAVTGCLKPVYQGGKKVGDVREYSDTLLMFLLRGKRPEVYGGLNERKLAELLTEKFAPYVVQAHEATPPRPPALCGPSAAATGAEPDPDED